MRSQVLEESDLSGALEQAIGVSTVLVADVRSAAEIHDTGRALEGVNALALFDPHGQSRVNT